MKTSRAISTLQRGRCAWTSTVAVVALATGVAACSSAPTSAAGAEATGTATGAATGVPGVGGERASSTGGAAPPSSGAGSAAAGAANTPGSSGATAVSGGAGSGPDAQAGAGTAAGTGGSTTVIPPTTEEYPPLVEPPEDEDGSELWLRYRLVPLAGRLAEYRAAFTHVVGPSDAPTLQVAVDELALGLRGLTGTDVAATTEAQGAGAVVLATPSSSRSIAALGLEDRLAALGPEGYVVEAVELDGQPATVVASSSDLGVLYGAFALLRHLQSHGSIARLVLEGAPKVQRRLLNHWDNLDGTIERGYAGASLWDWSALPSSLSPRYQVYARANASIGINGAVLNNVNANAQQLSTVNLGKAAALAGVLRPYGIRVYLTARFSAPIELGGLTTADPVDPGVQQWWADKVAEIYGLIGDFGGFLVKANSEGQPGPGDYGRSHAEGANMLADALEPHGGIVMWRAFVYSEDSPVDRIRQAYEEFHPLDGQFRANAMVQVKNGPLDFQPREPFSPLFGAMPSTPLALELQITKEYLGQDTHLAYLGPMYEEILGADTFADGAGSTVARVVDGSLHGHDTTALAGVSNVGSDTNWTGSHFNQANWYVFGRMAWDPDIAAETVAEEWVRQTLSNDPLVVGPVTQMMMQSRETLVSYMTPVGLAHIMASEHHYGPGPWVSDLGRAEWNPVYYHKADAQGIGFDRTSSGSNAVEQYFPEVRERLANRDTISDELLLFFHHVGWGEVLSSGRTTWDELVHRYSMGVDGVALMRDTWASLEGQIDTARFQGIADFLEIQHWEARWWRDACLTYFATFHDLPMPAGYAMPANALTFYQGLSCPANATKPRCPDINAGEPSPSVLP